MGALGGAVAGVGAEGEATGVVGGSIGAGPPRICWGWGLGRCYDDWLLYITC